MIFSANTPDERVVVTVELPTPQHPYFSVTTATHGIHQHYYLGGCDHATALRYFPDLHDAVALHMTDPDGAPLHALANALYWLQGTDPATTATYHGGNGSSARTPDACLTLLTEHLRISEALARTLTPENLPAFVEAQRPRWQAEADAVREKYQ